jgi:hypothetical protein
MAVVLMISIMAVFCAASSLVVHSSDKASSQPTQSALNQSTDGKTLIGISPTGHFMTYNGRTLMLIGDSGTQCVTQNKNLNYRQWIDDCAARGIYSIHVWSFLVPRQKQDGSMFEPRWGYVIPALSPWARRTSGPLATDQLYQWDLTTFDESPGGYWNRMRDMCEYARSRGVVIGVQVFFGWAKWDSTWEYHPFNVANGGHLTDNMTPQIIHAPGKEVWEESWSDDWPKAKKTQWVWERFSKKLIDELGSIGNVWFGFMDEHSYPEGNCGDHFLDFFKSRGMRWADWDRRRATVDMVYEQPGGDDQNAATVRYFQKTPARPFLILEGGPYTGEEVRTVIWTVSVGGGHFTFHNDERQENVQTGIMGYDPNVPDSDRVADMTRRDWLGHASRFFNNYVDDLDSMAPSNDLGSEGTYTLANPGKEYVIYSMLGSTEKFTVDLQALSGSAVCRFYNPRTGEFKPAFLRQGGSTQEFTKPDSHDWALYIRALH